MEIRRNFGYAAAGGFAYFLSPNLALIIDLPVSGYESLKSGDKTEYLASPHFARDKALIDVVLKDGLDLSDPAMFWKAKFSGAECISVEHLRQYYGNTEALISDNAECLSEITGVDLEAHLS